MADFTNAALPWIAMGLAVAVVTATYERNRKAQGRKGSDRNPSSAGGERKNGYLTAGLCLGVCIGEVLSLLGVVSTAYGLSFGLLFGVTTAACIKR